MGWISSKRKKAPHVCVVPIAVSGCKCFALHDEMPSEDKNIGEILNQNAAAPQALYRNFFVFFSYPVENI
ncbi:hypothetical protein LFH98_001115 [Neisseria gonorrhoeae]|uniref:hypothetical protein n=1 Tax=Neisseria gonorrhoeae TaxID=485 RepID=UPI0009E3148E|nr:hypothetical protein [Neisseria gonorrhoeae]MCF2974310.1 hypothetical protein [Neisseria gonorrhoeae]MCF3004909.1 hypothetical protein [Neisseria gonorrhoeae]MCF3010074.1 hypothetical protein [Neisseria gonorrhoeae]MCF3031646.1 hypothetical protein [Neisseria gonorrhoeae]MDO6059309.1 hypothetical protein [Neisseria gonorrhoeae]